MSALQHDPVLQKAPSGSLGKNLLSVVVTNTEPEFEENLNEKEFDIENSVWALPEPPGISGPEE